MERSTPWSRIMTCVLIAFLAGAGCASTPADDTSETTALAATADDEPPTMEEMGMSQYFIGLIYRGPTWSPEVTDEVMRIQAAHLENIGRLAAEGKMVLAGPFGDDTDLRGLFFFDVETIEEAEALCQTDPAVASGRLRVELHPWWATSALKKIPEMTE